MYLFFVGFGNAFFPLNAYYSNHTESLYTNLEGTDQSLEVNSQINKYYIGFDYTFPHFSASMYICKKLILSL